MAKTSQVRPWKERMTFLTPLGVEHTVNGQTLKFYPISVGLIKDMRHFIAPLMEAVMVLLTSNKNDTGVQQESIEDAKEKVTTRRTIMEGLTPELAKHRDGQKREALSALLEALFAEQAALVVGTMIVDSLRDVFSREDAENPEIIEQFVKGGEGRPALDARTAVELLIGWGMANKEVLGPLGLDAARELAARKLSELTSQESGGVGPRSLTVLPKTEISGESSPTPSSSPSQPATVPSGS